ncbi:unnamed protein product [Malus baccata var. baccata]
MPELRRGVRRGRARVASKTSDPPLRSRRTRATVAREAAAEAVVRPMTRLAIAEKYKEEGGDVDRIGSAFEPQRKWDGDGYEECCQDRNRNCKQRD